MKRTNIISGALALIGLMLLSTSVMATYTMDGDLSDWGLDLTQNWALNDTWVPNSGVFFQVEDNFDPTQYSGSYVGVHIRGVGSNYVTYIEPLVQKKSDGSWVLEPYGNDLFDIEAMYFDQDSDYVYVAIVLGEPADSGGSDRDPGDLALNLDWDINTGGYGYEYGVKLGTGTGGPSQWSICHMPNWEEGTTLDVKPTIFKSAGTCDGQANGAYVDSGIMDKGYTNYIIEMAIPKDKLGNPGTVSFYNLHMSEYCGNDHIPGASEFPMLISLVTLLVSPAFAYLIVKKRKG